MRTIAARNLFNGSRIYVNRKAIMVQRAYFGEDGLVHFSDDNLRRYEAPLHRRFRLAPERQEVIDLVLSVAG